MKCKVQTTLGMSKEHYQRSKTDPIYGSRKGAGHSITNWLFHITPIIKVIEKHYECCKISNPNKDIIYIKHIQHFLDDIHNIRIIGKTMI